MIDQRYKNAKYNIVISLATQLVAVVCGLIVPRILIGAYGSEAYGATASIGQFLSYITLLEGGISAVARAALYKPLADHDVYGISAVVSEIQRFFRKIACVFLVYVLVLAVSYYYIADVKVFDWLTTFLLVLVISISTFAEYFIGISNAILLQAAQKAYITKAASAIATIINAVMIVILVNCGSDLITVKLVSSCIFAIKPIIYAAYVKKEYAIFPVKVRNKELLSQKWTGLGQHLALFLHYNTDVTVLTILGDLKSVAVYSVYNVVAFHIQNITMSFSTGMEALFGDMLVKKEIEPLRKTINFYETLVSFVTMVLFGTAAVMIVPFVSLYTSGVTDADYYQPVFGLILLLSSALCCLRLPYSALTFAAGHFKQTKFAAYGEAIINIVLTVILVSRFGLIGLAIGTLTAVGFRYVYYVIYLSKNIVNRKISVSVRRFLVNAANFAAIYFLGQLLLRFIQIDAWKGWVLASVGTVFIAVITTLVFLRIFYRDDLKPVLAKLQHTLHLKK